MSRTYRRKNIFQVENTSWDRCHKKYEVNKKYMLLYVPNKEYDNKAIYFYQYGNVNKLVPVDKFNYRLNFLRYHGESKTTNSRSPGKNYREKYQRKLNTHNEREYNKWLNNEDYDPIFMENPQSCWWDWS